jgi:dihydrofolate synthase/folylpolyglutamate synthase
MESSWPHFLSELSSLTAERAEGRVAMDRRFPQLIKDHVELLAGRRIVKVTGTNGKGSVCAMLEACLRYEGLRVGLFTSPHLSRVTERFRVAGVEASSEMLERHAEEVLRIVRQVVDEYGDLYTPSFFECLVLIAIRLFSAQQVDVAIFEAGVGGYNDATSLLPGEFSVINNIGLDHREQLGDSLEAIAADKAGIASPDAHLVLGADISPTLRRVIEEDVHSRGVAVWQASLEGLRANWSGLHHPTLIDLSIRGQTVGYELPLLGRHQVVNFATVVAVVGMLARRGVVRDFGCLKGVEQTRWAGRLDVRDGSPCYIIDAAHNEHGMLALINSLDDLVPYTERVLLYGASAEKDYRAYLPHLSQLAPEAYLVEGFYRAEKASVIADLLPDDYQRLRIFPSPKDAVEFFAKSHVHRHKSIVATGSIFMIGEIMSCLDSLQAPASTD